MTAKAQSTSKRPLLVVAAIVLTVAVFAIEYAIDATNTHDTTEEVATETENGNEAPSITLLTETGTTVGEALEEGAATMSEDSQQSSYRIEANIIAIGTVPNDELDAFLEDKAHFEYTIGTGTLNANADSVEIVLQHNGETEQYQLDYVETLDPEIGALEYADRSGGSGSACNVYFSNMRVDMLDNSGDMLDIILEPVDKALEGCEPYVGIWRSPVTGRQIEITPGGQILFADEHGALLGSSPSEIVDGILVIGDDTATLAVEGEQLALEKVGDGSVLLDRVE